MNNNQPKKKRSGRPRTHVQISARLDSAVMGLALQAIKRDPTLRMSDLLNRAMLLALRELGVDASISDPRLLLNDFSPKTLKRILNLAAWEDLPKVRALTPKEDVYRRFILDSIDAEDTPNEEALRIATTPKDREQ
jgi:hypothetical protein